jgi:hypothetical protein
MHEDRIEQVIAKWQELPPDLRNRNTHYNSNSMTLRNPAAAKKMVALTAKRHRKKHLAICRMRSRLASYLRFRGKIKKDRTIAYLGCSLAEYRLYIEERFVQGMTWELFNKGKIHIDHIVPLSVFGNSDDELRRAFHYTNTQPMWARDNHSKGARWSGAVQYDLFNHELHPVAQKRRRKT